MPDVQVGEGSLDGRGIVASRVFEVGDVVVSYDLRRLTRDDYLTLPERERLFVHSYWGERWLYPAPARYINHADAPNTWQDFDRRCDIALRRIESGELITTDAQRETDRELATFMVAYEIAVNSQDEPKLESLIDGGAFGWIEGRGDVGRPEIIDAVWDRAHSDADVNVLHLSVGVPRWIVGTGRWEAICSYDYEIGFHSSPGCRSAGHVTDVLKVIDGNWQIIYRHESRS